MFKSRLNFRKGVNADIEEKRENSSQRGKKDKREREKKKERKKERKKKRKGRKRKGEKRRYKHLQLEISFFNDLIT